MQRLELSQSYYAQGDDTGEFLSGEVYHIVRNAQGGSCSTPIARYFVSSPLVSAEGFHKHQRLDCFVRRHDLAPQPAWLGRCLADALAQAGSIREPFWVSWHSSQEEAGEARGEVFDFD